MSTNVNPNKMMSTGNKYALPMLDTPKNMDSKGIKGFDMATADQTSKSA